MRVALLIACTILTACAGKDCPQTMIVDCPDIDECEAGDTDVGCGMSLVTLSGMDPDGMCWAFACISRPGEVDTCSEISMGLQGDLLTVTCNDPRVDHIMATCASPKCL